MNDNLFNESFDTNDGKKWVVSFGAIIYVLVLTLTAAHNWNLIASAVSPDIRWIAILGVIALELNAIAMPLVLHYWALDGSHRNAALVFYAIDLAILFANSYVDARNVTNGIQTMPVWAKLYFNDFAQVSPLVVAFMWAVLYSLDPSKRAQEKVKQVKQRIQMIALSRAEGVLLSGKYDRTIEERATQIGDFILDKAFQSGTFRRKTAAKPDNEDDNVKITVKQSPSLPSGNNHKETNRNF